MQSFWLYWPASALARAEAGFRSPESLVRNVYAHYGKGAPDFSRDCRGTRRPPAVLRSEPARGLDSACKTEPYDFLVQSPTWKLGPVAISILRRQFDKTYVAVAFDNDGRA